MIFVGEKEFFPVVVSQVEGLENLHIPGGAVKGVSVSERGGYLKSLHSMER